MIQPQQTRSESNSSNLDEKRRDEKRGGDNSTIAQVALMGFAPIRFNSESESIDHERTRSDVRNTQERAIRSSKCCFANILDRTSFSSFEGLTSLKQIQNLVSDFKQRACFFLRQDLLLCHLEQLDPATTSLLSPRRWFELESKTNSRINCQIFEQRVKNTFFLAQLAAEPINTRQRFLRQRRRRALVRGDSR